MRASVDMATRDAAAGMARQEFAVGRMGKCVIDLKNTNCTHTPSLTPPCAAELNNDVVAVGEKHHNLYPAVRERGESSFNCFSSWYPPIFFPTSLPGEVKPSSGQRSGVQKGDQGSVYVVTSHKSHHHSGLL